MIRRITLILLSFFYIINAQIALPTFQGVHKPHTTVAESDSQTFSYTGSQQTFTVPSGVTTITIKAWGAQGGSGGFWSNSNYCGTGGKGGYSTGELSVTPGNTVYIYVGGQGESHSSCSERMRQSNPLGGGWNGGGDGDYSYSGGGGGSGYIGGVSSAETIAGNLTIPDPEGGTMTGRAGDGLVIISW